MRLKELELDAQLEVPREVGAALKALAIGGAGQHQQLIAYRFILEALCGVDRMSFILADDLPMVMAWREGRRFVGLQLRRIVEAPMSDPEPPPMPIARTMTERARRRGPNPD